MSGRSTNKPKSKWRVTFCDEMRNKTFEEEARNFEYGTLPILLEQNYDDPYIPFFADCIKYIKGSRGTKIIITISSGAQRGRDSEIEMPNRKSNGNQYLWDDIGTKFLGEFLAEKIRSKTGLRPYVIFSNVHRSKFDANKDRTRSHCCQETEQCNGCAVFDKWHECIDMAKKAITANGSRGLLLEISGNSNVDMVVSLGYGALKRNGWEEETPSVHFQRISSIAGLLQSTRKNWVDLVVGKESLGGLIAKQLHHYLEFHDVPVIPSCKSSLNTCRLFIQGGYNIQRHGSAGNNEEYEESVSSKEFDAIQIETPYCFRMQEGRHPERVFIKRRNEYATALADAVIKFLRHYK